MTDGVAEGWASARLGELLEPGGLFDGPFGSSLKTSDYTDAGVRVIRLENVTNLRFVEDKHTYISHEKYESLVKHTVAKGDVIVGSFVDGAVRVCVLPSLSTKAIAKADCFCVRTRPELDRSFLALQLAANRTRDALVEEIHGATRPRITTRQLREFEILVAPLAEQRRIVQSVEGLLASLNSCRERLAKVPHLVKRFRQSVLAAACSGHLTEDWRELHPAPPDEVVRLIREVAGDRYSEADPLNEIPDQWRWTRLDNLRREDRPIIYGIIKPGPHVPNGVPYVRVVEMKDGVIDVASLRRAAPERAALFRRATLEAGDLLISKDGTIGRVAVVPPELEGGNITQHLVRFSPHPALFRDYLVRAIEAPVVQRWLRETKKGVALQGVNVEDFRDLPLPIPPVEEQRVIVHRVDALLRVANIVERRLATATARTDKLTQSILAKAFRGELVPTEAELARQEGREYEPASALLQRMHVQPDGARRHPNRKKSLAKT